MEQQRGVCGKIDWQRVGDVFLIIVVMGIIIGYLLWSDVLRYRSIVSGPKSADLLKTLVELMEKNNELLGQILKK
jgi:hypothetical protein